MGEKAPRAELSWKTLDIQSWKRERPTIPYGSLAPQLCPPAPDSQVPEGSNCIRSHLRNMFHIEGIYIKFQPNQPRPSTCQQGHNG